MSEFSGGYSPGGMIGKAARRQRARYAGKRSGRKRRQLGWARRGNAGPAQRNFKLSYELRQLTRPEFDQRYEKVAPRPERPSAALQWERKREAVWQHVISCRNLLLARGQHVGTTNGRRAVGLANRGHPRCERSIRSYNRTLEAMKVAGFQHVRTPAGSKDYLRVEWRVHSRLPISPCRQPCGTGNPPCSAGVPRRSKPPSEPPHDGVPPPAAAENEAASPQGTEEEQLEAMIRFQQLKLDAGWNAPAIEQRITHLKAQRSYLRRASCEHVSPPPDPEGSDG